MANQKNPGSNTGGINEPGAGNQPTGGRGKQTPGSAGTTGGEGNIGGATRSNIPGGGGVSKTSGAPIGSTGETTPTRTGTTGSMSPTGSSGTGAGTATARSLYDQAKETAGQAYEVAAEKATNKLEEQKSTLSGGLATVADSVRKVSENLRGPDVQDGISKFTAEYSDTAARKIEDIASYFEQKSVQEMYRDVENFARRNPAVFVGGAFALGLLVSRFIKSGSSGSRYSSSEHEGPISTASDTGSGQGIQGISNVRGITPGSSMG